VITNLTGRQSPRNRAEMEWKGKDKGVVILRGNLKGGLYGVTVVLA